MPRKPRRVPTSPEALAAAPDILADRMLAIPEPFTKEERDRLTDRLRAVSRQMALQGRRGEPVTDQERAIFLIGVASGLQIKDAAQLAGRAWGTFYALRRADARFREEMDDAMDASLDEIDERLRTIGMTGDRDSMSTVRALEVLRRGRSRTERRDLALTLRQEAEDGSVREVTVRALAPTPD